MKIDTKKIGAFLKSMDGVDYIYLENIIGLRSAIQKLIKRHNLTKADVCDRFKIKPRQYNNFTKGNYDYSMRDTARLNASFMELEAEKLEERVPVQVVKSGRPRKN